MDECEPKLWKRLAKVSEWSISLVFAESAVVGAVDARHTARFVSASGGFLAENMVYAGLIILYSAQAVASFALCIPSVTNERPGRSAVLGVLTSLSLAELLMHLHSNDWGGLVKAVMMAMSASLQLLDATSSRLASRIGGMLDRRGGQDTIDGMLGRIRELASRYRIGAHAAFVILLSVVYTFCTAESMRSQSALRSQLAKAQWTKTISFVALCAHIGSNDRDTTLSRPPALGRKKSL
jgi:hypothetical protein